METPAEYCHRRASEFMNKNASDDRHRVSGAMELELIMIRLYQMGYDQGRKDGYMNGYGDAVGAD
jgi:hypothetical protein